VVRRRLADHEQDSIYWHDAFFEALQLELYQYEKALEFISNHPLSKEALKMDALVIKKNSDVPVSKNIGRIFRKFNIFEYKSETVSINEHTYSKSIAYGLLYSSFTKVPVSDITISIVVTKHPRDLLKYLKNVRGFQVENKGNGLYYIIGDTFPVQILESKELSKEENLFLRNLRSNLSSEDAKEVTEAYKEIKPFEEKNVYLDRLIQANQQAFMEAIMLGEAAKALFLEAAGEEGWLDERDKQRDKQRDEWRDIETAKKMLFFGDTAEKVSKIMNIPLEKVKTLA